MASQKVNLSVNGWNGEYVDELYRRWSADSDSVDPKWRQFFQGFELGRRDGPPGEPEPESPPASVVDRAHTRQGQIDRLIYAYRDLGHPAADLDPPGTPRPALSTTRPASTPARRKRSGFTRLLGVTDTPMAATKPGALTDTRCGVAGNGAARKMPPASVASNMGGR